MTKARQKLLHTFSIDYTSDADQMRYQGAFTTKKLSVADSAALGVRKAQLNGGLHFDPKNPGHGIDEYTDDFNGMIAHLQISLTQAPKWWNLNEITDVNLVSEVYKEVAKFESSFHNRGRNGGDETRPMGSESQNSHSDNQEANPDGKSRAVVDSQVQAALEP